MPRVAEELPEGLKPYLFHSLDLQWKPGDKDALGDCPMCGREGKFSAALKTSQFHCFKCDAKGNAITFLQWLWAESDKTTKDYKALATDRKLLYPETLMHWGVAISTLTGNWIMPGYSPNGQLQQVYEYRQAGERMALLPTPGKGVGLGHKLFGMNLYDPSKPEVFLCEGPWDGMSLWEVLGIAKLGNQGLSLTSNVAYSLLADANVIAAPTCSTFFEAWLPLFAGKVVYLLYDNDHPRKHPKTGQEIAPAGLEAVKRIAKVMSEAPEPPREIRYLQWGPDGYNLDLPSGYDVRDMLTKSSERVPLLETLLGLITPVPTEWLGTPKRSATQTSGSQLCSVPCVDYRSLQTAWRKAMKWTPGLDRALSVMLASALSTKSVGEQLWIKTIGPPSSGKTTLVEGLAVASSYVLSKDTIRGMYSGWKDESGEDMSLAAQANGKTLAIKDGDTLLKAPNLMQILSEMRGIYDRVGRTHYRNAIANEYLGHRMTVILCGTSALREIDDSELGARFLDCVVMDQIEDEFEDEVGWRAANQEARNMLLESNGKAENQYPEELAQAMALTGGYVEHLRQNATALYNQIEIGEASLKLCNKLGKFVAYMRARPSKKQDESCDREFSARLVKQLVRLAASLAVVLNRKTTDDSEVMERVRRVALDTARGQTLAICGYLDNVGEEGLEAHTLALYLSRTDDKVRAMLRFLKLIGVLEPFNPVGPNGVQKRTRWRMTTKMRRLYHQVIATDKPS